MANFQGSALGALLTLLGWDGSDFRNVKVDSDGHPQVDILSVADLSGALESVDTDGLVAYIAKFAGSWTALSLDSGSRLMVAVDVAALPANASTETTVAAIRDRLGALSTPAAESVNWQLNKILAQVTAPSLPADAATEASLQGIEDQVKDTLYNIKSGLRDVTAIVGDGSNEWIQSTAVPAGEIWHVTLTAVTNLDSSMATVKMGTKEGGTAKYYHQSGSVAAYIPTYWQGHIWLDEGDQIEASCTGTTNLDNIELTVWGHIITV